MEQRPTVGYVQKQLREIAALLRGKANIPQVQAEIAVINDLAEDSFWQTGDVWQFEQVRRKLRSLIKFLFEKNSMAPAIITKLVDPIIERQEGRQLEAAYDFTDYRAKVNRYIYEHSDDLSIYKLTHNIPLTQADYTELERMLTCELGSREDYEREFGDTPFGLLVRKIAKLEHGAAMQAFSDFISDQSLNQQQIAFVHKVIQYIEQNGYIGGFAAAAI